MGNMVTNVKFNNDRFRIEKALGNFRKSDKKKKNKYNNIHSPLRPFRVQNKKKQREVQSLWT